MTDVDSVVDRVGSEDAALHFALTFDERRRREFFRAILDRPWDGWLKTWHSLVPEVAKDPADRAELWRLIVPLLPRVDAERFTAAADAVMSYWVQSTALGDDDLRTVVDWFVERADASHAPLAADAWIGQLTPYAKSTLLSWLLRHGLAELRRGERLPRLLDLLEAASEEKTRVLVLRALEQCDDRLDERRLQDVMDVLESLSIPEPTWRSLCADVLHKTRHAGWFVRSAMRGGHARPVTMTIAELDAIVASSDPVVQPTYSARPRIARLVTDWALAGDFDESVADAVWSCAFSDKSCVSASGKFRDASALGRATRRPEIRDGTIPADWLKLLVTEVVRIHQPLRRGIVAPDAWTFLTRVARNPDAVPVVFEALESVADRADPLDAALLREGGAHRGTIEALARRPRRESPLTGAGEGHDLASFRDHVSGVLNEIWQTRVGGVVLGQLGRFERVEFGELAREDAVRIDDGTVTVAGAYPRRVAATEKDHERGLALCTLYVIHELVHLVQRLGAKEHVRELRATGSETTLLHLDLAADHVAALAAREAVPRWTLGWLKDVQGRSLLDFPATRFHPFAARTRKAARVVALRADFHLRRRGGLRDDDGYAFVDFNLGGGAAFLLRSGPPVAILERIELSPDAAQQLAAAADEDADVRKIDAILTAALDIARGPSTST